MGMKEELIRITSEYFENTIDYLNLLNASKDYKNLMVKLVGQELDTKNGRNDIHLDNGKALGTFWAALCIDDLIRTRQFIRGINKAVNEKFNDKGSIHILYAGTGPFAALLLPIILRYSGQRIKYTLIEINPLTFDILKKVISELGLEDHDIRLLNEDATTYLITDDMPDIIISETMQNALAKEQQVPIFLNLMRQASFDSIFIPEKVEIFLGLKKAGISTVELKREHYHKEKKIFELSKESLFADHRPDCHSTEEITFPQKKTIITKERRKGYNQLVLLTEIQVFKDEKIRINESGLTTPLIIKDISDNLNNSFTIRSQYKICNEPKLEYDIVSHNKSYV
jgi:predicted RNA methylase